MTKLDQGISNLSRAARMRLNAAAGVFMLLRVPLVGADHFVAAAMQGRSSQKHLSIAGAGISGPDTHFGHLAVESDQLKNTTGFRLSPRLRNAPRMRAIC